MAEPSDEPRPDSGTVGDGVDRPSTPLIPEVLPASSEPSSSDDPPEEGGGPVMTFLEHLEDLRWMLIKVGAAVLIAMTVCLLGVNQLVTILKWPLERSRRIETLFFRGSSVQDVVVYFGSNRVAGFRTSTNHVAGYDLGTNRTVVLEVAPVQVNGLELLSLRHSTNAPLVEEQGRGPGLIFLDPAAPFLSSLHLAFFGGLFLASPFVFFYLGQFIVPALKLKEKKYGFRAFGIGIVLFASGVSFCYFGILPFALRAAEAYSLWMGIQMPDWRAETYFSFVTKFMFGMGLGFELPVVLLAFVKIGLLDYRKLAAMRRYMIVINLVLGALLTTPEVFTQIMMAVPLQVLYEVAVWIAWYWERQEKRRAAAAGETA